MIVLGGSMLCGAPPAQALDLPYTETFSAPDGSAWPTPWFAGGQHVTVWDVQNARGRLNGDPGFVARMILPDFAEVDVEVSVTFEFEDVANQGIGFYVRQNGGTLQEYLPHGQGYAMFLKGDWLWPEDLGIWREIDGVETQFATGYDPVPGGLENGVRYRLRYRVTQDDPATTRLQAKVWPESDPEPSLWTVETTDTRTELQGTAGSFAADIYNFSGFGHIFLDDLEIVRIGDPAGVDGVDARVPPRLQVRPNPLTNRAEIHLNLEAATFATLRVVDARGRLVATPLQQTMPAGPSSSVWPVQDAQRRPLAAGVYFLRLQTGSEVVRRIVVAGP
ncbi:MAG: T9SS type A sorting domain-containing protein [Candidatus Eisenbacteria bacterium]|uniref:T9SS type A sorting domain-containing protein n=1 Tax=Eiseniibacteriota bacterium TaxID=2212470 RepID=A0A956M1V5_UNCEI|nr:T9SS type A sorting domain-containing protein [Candidatus Eisenbacteria bacterium]